MYPFKDIPPEAYNKNNSLEVAASDPNVEVFLINPSAKSSQSIFG